MSAQRQIPYISAFTEGRYSLDFYSLRGRSLPLKGYVCIELCPGAPGAFREYFTLNKVR
jgi:hypothetical protein